MSTIEGYILCTAPRSGSTMLCRLLTATGVAGKPESLFHRPSLSDWCAGLNLVPDTPLAQIIAAARQTGRAGTGMFGLRLQRHSAPFFFDQLATLYPDHDSDHARLTAAFGNLRFLHLTRADKVAQAVSLLRAEQSGLWHKAPDGSEIERTAPPQEPHYDAPAIAEHVASFKAYDDDWRNWFKSQNITPHRITYDALSDDPLRALTGILNHLDLDPKQAENITPRTAKLAGATSAAWIRQFKADQANP
ncbi:Stf0 family sulfotransferase [uncultured Tateyamaria sp.]|uniref:Stf0 family sulfotransferase n=1 Tax=uncultured Tateyamaria sp. TaxID=455651 RepID=UPI0026305C2D|nr:Stf0 family sulfotransferase [uncultured Tateyamaria sp.]